MKWRFLIALLPAVVPLVLNGTTRPQSLIDRAPEGLEQAEWRSIRAAHEAWKHEFRWAEDDWKARNPGQRWSTRFDGRGFLATPDGANWTWGKGQRRWKSQRRQKRQGMTFDNRT